tara:strand:- start:274 stop:468 length:195 start_codon:yes stop_codon:yes gene_type:complete
MAEKKEIEFTVKKDGTIDVEALTHKGDTCLTEIGELLEGLGAVTSTQKKPTFYEKERVERVKQK